MGSDKSGASMWQRTQLQIKVSYKINAVSYKLQQNLNTVSYKLQHKKVTRYNTLSHTYKI